MNCIIVDDEFPARQELSYFVNNFSDLTILEQFDDSIKALEFIQNHQTDILFLDIDMPKLDGVALSRIIKNFNSKPKLVFITAHREYAVDAFEVEAFDYILKPYSEDRIVAALKKLEKCEISCSISNKITLWKNDKMIVININDICYCQAHEREVHVFTRDDQYVVSSTISDFYKKLSPSNFFKCHRSYVVNVDKIIEIIPWFNNTYILKLQGMNTDIPVSRHNIADFKHIMGI